jgi:hypothetical protein
VQFIWSLHNNWLQMLSCNFISFLIIFDNVLLWTLYKSPMLCGPLSLPNLRNNIATIFNTDTITLKQVSSLQIRVQPLGQVFECIVFHLSSLPKIFSFHKPQQQTVYKSGHPILTPYTSLSIPHTLINQAQNCELLSFSLPKQCLNIHNMLHKHVQKHI